MRIPNASPSPPKIRATTSTSGAPSFTIPVTPPGGASSRFSKGFPCGNQERGSPNAVAVHGARECLQRRLSATPVRRIARHVSQPRQKEGRRGVGTGQHVVEHMLRAITEQSLRSGGGGGGGGGAAGGRGPDGGRGPQDNKARLP